MKKSKYAIFVVFSAISWGFLGYFNRILAEVEPNTLNRVTIRDFLSLVCLVLVFAMVRRSVFRFPKKRLLSIGGSGLLSVFGLSVVYLQAQVRCSLATAGTLLYLAPSMVVLMSALIWREKITWRKGLALFFALIGCALVCGLAGGELSGTPDGILLGIASAFCYATYTIFSHYSLQDYDLYTVIFWTFVFAGLASLAVADYRTIGMVFTSWKGIFGAFGVVVIGTVLPYFFYTKGLEGLEGGKASIIATLEPVVTALTGIFLLGESMDIWKGLGIVLVLSGVFLLAEKGEKNGEKRG